MSLQHSWVESLALKSLARTNLQRHGHPKSASQCCNKRNMEWQWSSSMSLISQSASQLVVSLVWCSFMALSTQRCWSISPSKRVTSSFLGRTAIQLWMRAARNDHVILNVLQHSAWVDRPCARLRRILSTNLPSSRTANIVIALILSAWKHSERSFSTNHEDTWRYYQINLHKYQYISTLVLDNPNLVRTVSITQSIFELAKASASKASRNKGKICQAAMTMSDSQPLTSDIHWNDRKIDQKPLVISFAWCATSILGETWN